MQTIYRIVYELGWVEFADKKEAEAYRDQHHVGSEIQELQRDLSYSPPE